MPPPHLPDTTESYTGMSGATINYAGMCDETIICTGISDTTAGYTGIYDETILNTSILDCLLQLVMQVCHEVTIYTDMSVSHNIYAGMTDEAICTGMSVL